MVKLSLDIANGMKCVVKFRMHMVPTLSFHPRCKPTFHLRLRYVAKLRILHIDLKAENVLLQKAPEGEDTRGTGMIAKVADFGLAQVR